MATEHDDILNSIREGLSKIDFIPADEIPNINLYMDQVTTFMDDQLSSTKRNEEDKILTKTMINNYAKNDLLPPPEKKKYSKEHILFLTFIYYFKNFLSIKDIETLLEPLTENYFHQDSEISLSEIYERICKMEQSQTEELKDKLTKEYEEAESAFSDVSDENQRYLQILSFICELSFDIYERKQIIETMLDTLPEFTRE